MPTYEYECNACGHAFEEFQYMSEKPLRKCPACSKMKLQRLIGAGAGIIFKGSGFYETDYKRKEQSTSAGAGKQSPAASETKAETPKAADASAAKIDGKADAGSSAKAS